MADSHGTDYSKHTEEELREGLRKSDEEAERIKAEDSGQALQANRDQHAAMQAELDRRNG